MNVKKHYDYCIQTYIDYNDKLEKLTIKERFKLSWTCCCKVIYNYDKWKKNINLSS